jgi:hypothetical protein
MAAPKRANTAAATQAAAAAARRRKLGAMAAELRAAGWLPVAREHSDAVLTAVQYALDDPSFFELTDEQIAALQAVQKTAQ